MWIRLAVGNVCSCAWAYCILLCVWSFSFNRFTPSPTLPFVSHVSLVASVRRRLLCNLKWYLSIWCAATTHNLLSFILHCCSWYNEIYIIQPHCELRTAANVLAAQLCRHLLRSSIKIWCNKIYFWSLFADANTLHFIQCRQLLNKMKKKIKNNIKWNGRIKKESTKLQSHRIDLALSLSGDYVVKYMNTHTHIFQTCTTIQ